MSSILRPNSAPCLGLTMPGGPDCPVNGNYLKPSGFCLHHMHHSTSQYLEIASLAAKRAHQDRFQQASRLAKEKRWVHAAAIVDTIDEGDINPVFRRRCLAARDFVLSGRYQEMLTLESVSRRSSKYLLDGWKVANVETLPGGKVGLMNNKIELEQTGKDRLMIFEKVYIRPVDTARASKEIRLHMTVPSHSLHAPCFYGSYQDAYCISLAYQYIPGRPPQPTLDLLLRTVSTLWHVDTPQGLVDSYHQDLDRFLDHFLGGELATQQKSKSNYDICWIVNSILSRGEAYSVLKESPKCVMHHDVGAHNVLLYRGSELLIDWDKWMLFPVGFGLTLSKPADMTEELITSLERGPRSSFPGFRFCLAVGCALQWLRAQERTLAISWLEKAATEYRRLKE